VLLIGREMIDGKEATAKSVATIDTPSGIVRYRLLAVGDLVEEGQVLALLEDTLAKKELKSKLSLIATALAELEATRKTAEEFKSRYEASRVRHMNGRIGFDELEEHRLTWERCNQEIVAKSASVVKANQEVLQTRVILRNRNREIRSPIRGSIESIVVEAGQAVRTGQPLFTIRPLRAR
jgi:multidrug efflux pump subunit AcrA (membrane-fusion protein)